jgi:hypothetical protein
MSKDKGSKNHKKAPADKSKGKVLSRYKSEGKSGQDKQSAIEAFVRNPDTKTGGSQKS